MGFGTHTFWIFEPQKYGFRSYTKDLSVTANVTEVDLNLKIKMCSRKGLKGLRYVVNQLARLIASSFSDDFSCIAPPNGDGWPIEMVLTYSPNDDVPTLDSELVSHNDNGVYYYDSSELVSYEEFYGKPVHSDDPSEGGLPDDLPF